MVYHYGKIHKEQSKERFTNWIAKLLKAFYTTHQLGKKIINVIKVWGVFYNFPKIFQAKLNKKEWNIFKYIEIHCWSWTKRLANHLLQNYIDIIGLYNFLGFSPKYFLNSSSPFLTPSPLLTFMKVPEKRHYIPPQVYPSPV